MKAYTSFVRLGFVSEDGMETRFKVILLSNYPVCYIPKTRELHSCIALIHRKMSTHLSLARLTSMEPYKAITLHSQDGQVTLLVSRGDVKAETQAVTMDNKSQPKNVHADSSIKRKL